MYNLSSYGFMMTDEARMDAHTEALRRAITPGAVVMDIGTGHGIFAMLACRFGAGKVYAIEPSDSISVARQAAVANGMADRITFIQGMSTDLTFPERADVIITDLRGRLPFYGTNIQSIFDARTRLLKPGGVLIPQRDNLWVGVINAEQTYDEYMAPWRLHGFDYSAATRIVTNTTGWSIKDVKPDNLMAKPQQWAELDYNSIEDPNVSGEVTFTASRDGVAHGLLIWFDTVLSEGVGFSNAPGSEKPTKVFGRSFFPWTEPVDLHQGDQIRVKLEARFIGKDYIYLWETEVEGKAHFNQSTFFGSPVSISNLRKQAAEYVPELRDDGRIDQFILSRMSGQISLGKIADQLIEEFPDQFKDWRQALTRAGELSLKYA